ncbi:MAG: cytidylate kinase-like family protein [Desulfobacter sp.]|nr:MAG: cytidylate kinase-like family protein [Desulfobacter sp.]
MPVIAITCGLHTAPRQLIEILAETYGATVCTDTDLVEATSLTQGLPDDLIFKVVHGKPVPHNEFTHDRERCVSGLKKTLSDAIARDNCIFIGIISHLIPASISHVFKILSTAPQPVRIRRAVENGRLSESSAESILEKADRRAEWWVKNLTGKLPLDTSQYDLVIAHEDAYTNHLNMDETLARYLAEQIKAALAAPPFNQPAPNKISDFCINSNVEVALSAFGTGLLVDTQSGNVTVTLDRKVMNLSKIQQQIMAAATAVPGVETVKTKIGPNYYKGSIVKNFNIGPPRGYRSKP